MTALLNTFEQLLSRHLNYPCSVEKILNLSGGCINQAYRIETRRESYFIKINKSKRADFFKAESKGLNLLRENSSLTVPEVLGFGETEDFSYLILSYINSEIREKNYWQNFGIQLARLHRQSNRYFGLDHDNYIGSLPQFNKEKLDWVSFFIVQRLQMQLKLAINSGRISTNMIRQFEKLFLKLKNFLPEEAPSLLHGDLWSGNVMTGSKGEAVLIDPAVYYGNREMDLAFTTLFGGFEDEFYESYKQEFPLESGYEDRFEIYNLYPLLVHVNLFGGGYLHSVSNILSRYS